MKFQSIRKCIYQPKKINSSLSKNDDIYEDKLAWCFENKEVICYIYYITNGLFVRNRS